jgi:hypothetical protein
MKKNILLVLFLSASVIAQQQHPSIIFVSDTQQPLWIETFRLEEHNNKEATTLIYSEIEHESTAVAIFHLGDITSIGMIDSYWRPFDEFRKNIRVPIYPLLGNHEYYIFKKPAMEQFQKRFPSITKTWYSIIAKSVAVIALNSNFSKLSDDERSEQELWYREQLSRYENDSTVSSIIVLCHHSPYTNSTIVDPSLEVQQQFLAPFLLYHKTSVFISGHAHAYEHFQKRGKELLVIGGGGGLLQPLLTGTEQRFRDVFSQEQSLRFFHYVECTIQQNSLQFLVKKLRSDLSGFDIVDTITVPYHE